MIMIMQRKTLKTKTLSVDYFHVVWSYVDGRFDVLPQNVNVIVVIERKKSTNL